MNICIFWGPLFDNRFIDEYFCFLWWHILLRLLTFSVYLNIYFSGFPKDVIEELSLLSTGISCDIINSFSLLFFEKKKVSFIAVRIRGWKINWNVQKYLWNGISWQWTCEFLRYSRTFGRPVEYNHIHFHSSYDESQSIVNVIHKWVNMSRIQNVSIDGKKLLLIKKFL